jgi:hypothetical protein
MAEQSMTPSRNSMVANLEQVREQILTSKAEYRSHLAKMPIVEKLRILEEMRDFTSALQATRDENKARLKEAWAGAAEPVKAN